MSRSESYIQPVFDLPNSGFFVEVGAYDGDANSHTAMLADSGDWDGIYIEPVPEHAARCRARHAGNKRIQVVECAVGSHSGTIELNVSEQITTSRKDIVELWDSDLMRKFTDKPTWNKLTVLLRTLDSIVGDRPIDLLVVDVEGMEDEVISTLRTKPKLAIVEMHEASDDWESIRQGAVVREFFKDYKVVGRTDTDTYFAL